MVDMIDLGMKCLSRLPWRSRLASLHNALHRPIQTARLHQRLSEGGHVFLAVGAPQDVMTGVSKSSSPVALIHV